jgi:hypothetical protein
MTHLSFATQAVEAALAADNVTLKRKADKATIKVVIKVLEKEILPQLSGKSIFGDEIDFCIAWFGLRRLAVHYIPDVEAAVATLRGKDWVKIRELCVKLSHTALQQHCAKRGDSYRRFLLAA